MVIPFEFTGNLQEFIEDILERQKSIKEFSLTEISFRVGNEFSQEEIVLLEKYFEILI